MLDESEDVTLEPVIVLPEQLLPRRSAVREPERRLMVAMLEEAVRCFQHNLDASDRKGRALYEDAAAWFAGGEDFETFSFANICDALDIDPDCVRDGLGHWRDRERARRAASSPAARARTSAYQGDPGRHERAA